MLGALGNSFKNSKGRPISADDIISPNRPKIPAIEAIGRIVGQQKKLIVIERSAIFPDRQRIAFRIMARCGCYAFAVEEQASEAIAHLVAGPSSDGLHEQKAFGCLVAALSLIVPSHFRHGEGDDLPDLDDTKCPKI